jgi:predicted nucleic acid-binding protein
MIIDTNLLVYHIRKSIPVPINAIIPIVVVAEIKSLATQWGWGAGKQAFIDTIVRTYPVINISPGLVDFYTQIDTYSQGKHPSVPMPSGQSAKPMGKNDIWIATVAMTLGETLETTDKDFDHLRSFGLTLIRRDANDPYNLPTF